MLHISTGTGQEFSSYFLAVLYLVWFCPSLSTYVFGLPSFFWRENVYLNSPRNNVSNPSVPSLSVIRPIQCNVLGWHPHSSGHGCKKFWHAVPPKVSTKNSSYLAQGWCSLHSAPDSWTDHLSSLIGSFKLITHEQIFLNRHLLIAN